MHRRTLPVVLAALALALGAALAVHAQSPGTRVVGDALAVSGGQLYEIDSGIGWTAVHGLPIPADQVAAAQRGPSLGLVLSIIDVNGNGWANNGAGSWTSYGPVPGATPALRQSWSELKDRFK
jgi:hypothetical protein